VAKKGSKTTMAAVPFSEKITHPDWGGKTLRRGTTQQNWFCSEGEGTLKGKESLWSTTKDEAKSKNRKKKLSTPRKKSSANTIREDVTPVPKGKKVNRGVTLVDS